MNTIIVKVAPELVAQFFEQWNRTEVEVTQGIPLGSTLFMVAYRREFVPGMVWFYFKTDEPVPPSQSCIEVRPGVYELTVVMTAIRRRAGGE